VHVDLEGKTALVTGATRGIGAAIALGLAQAGADIMAVSASVTADGETARAVRALGRRFTAHRVDFSDRAATQALCDGLAAEAPPIDILVNNAGTIRRAPAAEHPASDFDAVLETNLAAPFLLTQSVARGMLARGSGKIVFIASVLSFQGGINVPGYAAAKGGVAQLTKALANEWAGRGVNVNAIAPGYIATDNTAALQADEARATALLARTPAGRWGRPQDIAGAAVFLASRHADFIHGAVIPVDGGWLAR
jgi:2-deoxy-D-gluconate 3-dehydrogenase